ncbi:unnamed protein product [Paramecium sonneborni]|uniref:Uncharacterized protein n=1 Tax=Paramecium sonneborni TaxID=65129 RepID=A0A8S1MQA9_9CILI|nr:unnamed protein product [Paramecium sonneborni]
MNQYWDVERFRLRYPNNFDNLGSEYIQLITRNVELILDHFNSAQFHKAISLLAELFSLSFVYQVKYFAESLRILQDYLEAFIQVEGNQMRMKEEFNQNEKQKAAQYLLEIIEAAKNTINDWNKFMNQQIDKNIFTERVDLLRHKFQLQVFQNCIRSCQLI